MKPIELWSYDFPPGDGGISRLCSAMVEELARRGRFKRTLTVVAGTAAGPNRPDVPTVVVPRRPGFRELMTAYHALRAPADTCVISSVWNPEGSLAWLLRKRDALVMAHGNEVMPYPAGPRYRLKGWLRRQVLQSARTVVCNSRYTEGLVKAIAPDARAVVIPPGVDAARFAQVVDIPAARQRLGLPTTKRLVLSVARMDAYKGHDVVLRALAQLPAEAKQNLHYAVAGRGAHLPVLQQLAASLGVQDMVSWLGFVSDQDLPSLYGCADLFALCTREDPLARGVEGFGMVFLEAQAAGVPVVGTRAGGIPDAIEPGNGGWLFEQDDVGALQKLLAQLAADVTPFLVQGSLGRQRARTVGSWRHYVNQLLKVVDVKP